MEKIAEEQANLVRLINEGLSVIRQKKMEYLACSADGNPNWEYFKGKADAYEYAHKTFKRILEWTSSGSVAAPKEEDESLNKLLSIGDKHFIIDEITALREALKELLPIAERLQRMYKDPTSLLASYEQQDKAIIERARKLILK